MQQLKGFGAMFRKKLSCLRRPNLNLGKKNVIINIELERVYMKKILIFMILIILIVVLGMVAINLYVVNKGGEKIFASTVTDDSSLTFEELEDIRNQDFQVALVLGAGLNEEGKPSQVLQDRLDLAIYLYEEGVVEKLLLSGDNGQITYDEVQPMFEYTRSQGVEEEDIFLDYAGFSTYESIYRAEAVFQVDKMIIVTQKYHLYRAEYIATSKGIESIGIGANQSSYDRDWKMEFRESLARIKDFIYCVFNPEPTYLGDPIPIEGDGNITHIQE